MDNAQRAQGTQGETPPLGQVFLNLPHYKTFVLTVARPVIGKMGVTIGRENDGRLGYKTFVGVPSRSSRCRDSATPR